MHQRLAARSRGLAASSAVAAVAFFCLVLIVTVWGLSLARDHQQQLANAETTAQRITGLLAEHAERSFESALMVLGHLQIEARLVGLGGLLAPEGGWTHLTLLAHGQPQLGGMALLDPTGGLMAAVDDHGLIAQLDVARLVAGPAGTDDGPRFTSIPGRDGVGGVAVSSRLTAADGSPVGLAIVVVRAAYFDGYYATLDLGPRGAVGLAALDGGILVRRPAPRPDQRAAAASVSIPHMGRRMVSPLDGVERITATRSLNGLPVLVYTGLAVADVMRGWHALLAASLASGTAGIVFLAFLVRLAWRATRSEETARDQLARALAEKNLLFQEIHHRIKNNLHVVSSMITMQATRMADGKTRGALLELTSRITSMSLVHEILYRHDQANIVALDPLLGQLAAAITRSYDSQRRIAVTVDGGGHALPLERAIPLALAANEAMVNAFKHAFPSGRRGTVAVSFDTTQASHRLRIRDDGVGLPDGPKRSGSLGMRLSQALAGQLGGACRVTAEATGGTTFELSFPS